MAWRDAVAEQLDEVYLAMQQACAAMEAGCDCGCLDDAREGLEEAMVLIERMRD